MSGLNAHGFSRAAPCRNLRLARQIRLVLPAHKDRKQTNRAILSIYYFDNEQLERAWFFGQGTLASQLATLGGQAELISDDDYMGSTVVTC